MELGTTKYIIYAELIADGYVEKHDIIGAIFGQTEGLLSKDLDLRDLQKSGRVGRIDVELDNSNGKSYAKIILPSSLDRVETAILAATLETIDRVGPCVATVNVIKVEDIRIKKREYITQRAKELLKSLMENMYDPYEITEEIKEYIRIGEIIEYGDEKLPAGPNIDSSDAIIVVEGRADVLNLLRCGIKNAIGVNGTSIPKTIIELSKKKTTTIFTDGDRGGELILKEAIQLCDVDYIARAPHGREVEELSKKEIIKCLRLKIPIEQYIQLNCKDYCSENGKKEDGGYNTFKEGNNHYINNFNSDDNIYNNINNKINSNNNILSNSINVDKINTLNNITSDTPKNIYNDNNYNNNNITLENGLSNDLNNNNVDIKTSASFDHILKDTFESKDINKWIICFEKIFKSIDDNDIFVVYDNYKTSIFKNMDNIEKPLKSLKLVVSPTISQKLVDMVYSENPIIVGNRVSISKKPVNVRLYIFSKEESGYKLMPFR